MSKKLFLLLLLIPLFLIMLFIIVNYKAILLAIESYNIEDVYMNDNKVLTMDFVDKVLEDIENNNYKQYMLDVTDYYITSDFVVFVFDKLGLLDSYLTGIRSKMFAQYIYIFAVMAENKDKQKYSEMLKYYPIEDIENFTELTLKFIDKIYDHISIPMFALIGYNFITTDSIALCYLVMTYNGCNNNDYYLDKYIYTPAEQIVTLYKNKVPMDKLDNTKKNMFYENVDELYSHINTNVRKITNECGL